MRTITALLCSLLLVASLFGLAQPDQAPQGVLADAIFADPLAPESPCGKGQGHGTCQLVEADRSLISSLATGDGASRFEIAPEAADGRSLAPHTPPPRRLL